MGKPGAVSGCGELGAVSVVISLNVEMAFDSANANMAVWLQSTTSRTFLLNTVYHNLDNTRMYSH